MRIISGKHKGRRILAPKKLPVRPTKDMAKEGLFNILSNRYPLEEAVVLDLFSGTGNIAYEFASRGTKVITVVDNNISCVQFITKTARELGLDIRITKANVFSFLKKTQATYDIIFADPPYHLSVDDFLQLPYLIFENELLRRNGLLVVEHAPQTDLSGSPYFTEQRKYGSSVFSFFMGTHGI